VILKVASILRGYIGDVSLPSIITRANRELVTSLNKILNNIFSNLMIDIVFGILMGFSFFAHLHLVNC
jgi:hypothetical protein